jgi:small subunit ribosomal protein S17e
MGRVKTKLIKRTVINIIKKNPNKFSSNFDDNKKIIGEAADIPSKKLRNVIVGYITRLTKMKVKKPRF